MRNLPIKWHKTEKSVVQEAKSNPGLAKIPTINPRQIWGPGVQYASDCVHLGTSSLFKFNCITCIY